MDRYDCIRKPISKKSLSEHIHYSESSNSESEQSPAKKIAVTSKLRSYKHNWKYDAAWKKKYPWIVYDSDINGMLCSVCKMYRKVPAQVRGMGDWVKATSLLLKHEKSDWHVVAMEKKALSLSTSEHGNVVEQIVTASAEERKQNRELMKLI